MMENRLFETDVSGASLAYNDLIVKFLAIEYNVRSRQDVTALHTHPFFEFYMLLSGRQISQIREHEFAVNINEFFLVPPNVEHGHRHVSELHDEGIVVRFSLEKRPNSVGCAPIADRVIQALSTTHIRAISDTTIFSMLTDIPKEMSLEARHLRMLSWILHLCRIYEEDVFVAPKQNKTTVFSDKQLVNRVFLTLNTMHMTDLSVKDIAASHNISYRHLSRVFQQSAGCTLVQAITYIRIQKSFRLLRETNLPVREIAHRVGFRSEGYFTSVFSKFMGQSPSLFRIGAPPARTWEEILADFSVSPECVHFDTANPWK